MADKKGKGLLMIWVDVPKDKEDELNHWYNEEHLAQILSMPGVLNAARYEAVMSGPKHLACYELENPDVFQSDEYRQMQKNPTDLTKQLSLQTIATTFIRGIYEVIHPSEVSPDIAASDMAPALQIGRMGVPSEVEDEFNDWYNTIYVPNYEKVPGVIRGRRYRVVSGEPKYMTVYEFEHEKVSESAEWAAQRDIDPLTHRIRPQMQHATGSPGIWKKTFQL